MVRLGSHLLALSAAGVLMVSGCAKQAQTNAYPAVLAGVQAGRASASATDYGRYREEIEGALQRELAFFYPACVDEQGGFTHARPADWAKMDDAQRRKNIIFQARMTWTAAEVAQRRPAMKDEYLGYARHGYAFLRKMWDAEEGGFFWLVDEQGGVTAANTDKHAYGQAFAIYALVNVYRATGDEGALELAERAFRWLDEKARDGKNGGYFGHMNRAGKVLESAAESYYPEYGFDLLGDPYMTKSMNVHIHILEALTELAKETKDDALVRKRLDEVFWAVRDRFAVMPGCLNLYMTPRWQAMPMPDSFGHDVETAYLLWEADLVRHGRPSNKTRQVTRALVDHALSTGWDGTYGGFYYEGHAYGKPINTTKSWWTQAEGLNALLLMHELYGAEDPRYWRAFVHQWAFIKNAQIDPKDGGWYYDVSRSGEVTRDEKISAWKASYHSGRAMMNVTQRLAEMEGKTGGGE